MPRATGRFIESHFAWIAAGIALAILYGSFYPFGFYLHHDSRGPVGVLLASGFRPASHDDVVQNILLYIPFGFFAACALQRRTLAAILGGTVAGFALSLFVELAQFYDAGRYQEITDVCSNSLGSLLGACAAAAVRRRVSSLYLALLLACWFGSRAYPAPPAALIPPLDLLRYFAAWLAVGLMLEALAAGSRSRVVLPIFLCVTLLVRSLAIHVEPAELAGGAAAALLWCGFLWRIEARAKVVATVFVAVVVLLALAPFHFSSVAREFNWVPFAGFLKAPPDTAIRVFFEKAFLYGGMTSLLVLAGFSIGASAAFGAALVFGLRLIQVYLPGRSAEITDVILLLMLAAMMKLIALGELKTRSESA